MRLWLTGLAGLLLVAATVRWWNHRFERVPGVADLTLDLLATGLPDVAGLEVMRGADGTACLRLSRPDPARPTAVLIPLAELPPASFVLLDIEAKARALRPGPLKWQDGRVLMEWQSPRHPDRIDRDAIASARHDDACVRSGVVVRPLGGPATAALRLEHHGESGVIDIRRLRMIVVRERLAWKIASVALVGAWIGWWGWLVRRAARVAWSRSLLAGVVMVVVSMQFMVPGPWRMLKPMFGSFHVEGTSTGELSNAPSVPMPSVVSDARVVVVEPLGKLEVSGSLALRLKYLWAKARPVLHSLMLAAPVFLLAMLAGRRTAVMLGILIAAGIECSQIAFGYGFGVDDAFDLLCDAAGIALGVLCWRQAAAGSARLRHLLGRNAAQ